MTWTLGTVMSRATHALGGRADIALSDASHWANEAHRECWDAQPHDLKEGLALSSTTSGGDKIALPSDFFEPIQLSNVSAVPYRPLAPVGTHELDSWSTALGSPTHYALFSNWLELRPAPDSAYSLQLRYHKQVSELTVVGAPLSVATRFHRAVFLKTKELLAQHVIHDPEQAMVARAEYVAYMGAQAPDRSLRLRENRFVGLGLPRSRAQTPSSTAFVPFDRRVD